MKRPYQVAALALGLFMISATATIAAPKIINITRRLGGVVGSVFKLDGTLQVQSLSVSKTFDAKYDNKISGLKATTYKGAVDELGISVKKLISGTSLKNTSTVKASSLTSTTWKGYAYIYSSDPFNSLVTKTQQVTVTFTPTSSTAGTFTSSPLYAFGVGGDHFAYDLSNTSYYSPSTPYTVCARQPITGWGLFHLPTGTYGGKYQIIGDESIWTFPTLAQDSPCVAPPVGFFGTMSHRSGVTNRGTTMTLTNEDGTQVIMERQ